MMNKLRKLLKGERGITGLETAIILVAFVVVAAVFSFAILSAGTYATQKSEEAIYAGLEEVRSTVQLKGSVIGQAIITGTNGQVDSVVLTIGNVAGGEAVDLTEPTFPTVTTSSSHRLVIDYVDQDQHRTDLTWQVTWVGQNDGDVLLEEGELAEIWIPVTNTVVCTLPSTSGTCVLTPALGINTGFMLDMRPVKGAVLRVEGRTPASIDPVITLAD